MQALGAALLLLVAAGPVPCPAGEAGAAAPAATPSPPPDPAHSPPLTVDLTAHSIATGGMLLVSGLSQLEANKLTPPSCRWCEPTRFDRWARHQLRWTDVKTAGLASTVLVVAVPAGTALTLGLAARAEGASGREVEEDLLVVTEAASAAVLLTQAAKFATARVRPDAWAGSGHVTADGRMSFWGGHSAFAFSVAAGATQVARLRGRPGWRWLALASFAGAAATGWLRVAADRHWTTDVLAGAAVGTAAGLAVPLLVMHPAGERGSAVTLVPVPGGLALVF